MQFKKRTVTCGELRIVHVGSIVTLNGWVDRRRDLGGLIFIDLRDRYGKTQVVFQPQSHPDASEVARELRSEYVLSVTGEVRRRPEGTVNPKLQTGEIEVVASEVQILSKAETPPFPVEDQVDVSEETRLRYRYIDLRRPLMQRNLLTRHRMYQITRRYFDELGFVEIETPVLMKSTPEGARDYLVPSRIHPGKFYALPQSPQTYKQILMVAGFDRYFQIVKCFRDEDLRADRQPEFTQIDVEMSFIDESDVMSVVEGLMVCLFKEIKGIDIAAPFPRLTYTEAIQRYGTDKPDLRFGMTIQELSSILGGKGFKLFDELISNGGIVAGISIPRAARFSRKQLEGIAETAQKLGASGLVFIKVLDGSIESPIEKYVGSEVLRKVARAMNAESGSLIVLTADAPQRAYPILGNLRMEVARQFDLIPEDKYAFAWVTEFPLLEYSEEEGRYVSMHHPFTAPKPEDADKLESDPLHVKARAYDLILNGNEIAGGSIRIQTPELQTRIFRLLGITDEEARKKFGFLLDAFRYGAPPHGGIAFGFDRIAMILTGQKSIRDVIAFPKTSSAVSLMDDSPSEVTPEQLAELHIKLE
ncbi:MAG: aspartate--tRNA ligase [Bacteroidota bacterium]